jgi:hypothetical protein
VAHILFFAGSVSTTSSSQNTRACPFIRAPDIGKQILKASTPETFFWIRSDVLP